MVKRKLWWIVAAALVVAVPVVLLTYKRLSARRIAINEAAAISWLRNYLCYQNLFDEEERYPGRGLRFANPFDGAGFPDLYHLGGRELREWVDPAFAAATDPQHSIDGYYFVDITGSRRTGPYNYARECGLCAVPAEYGRTGINTHIVDVQGTCFQGDTGGKPVTSFPDLRTPEAEKVWLSWMSQE